MLDRILGLAAVASFAVGSVVAPAGPASTVAFTFTDQAIVESSGLVALPDGLFVTVNDSGDSGRVFVVDGAGDTVGVTSWSPTPTDDESLAPAGPGSVWVGDTGDNTESRSSISVRRVPVGRGDRTVSPTAYSLVYPDGPHDAETLLAQPRTGQLFVVSKDLFGGTLYAAPRTLSATRPNKLRRVSGSLAFATDGSFFPDGRHYVVRGYFDAAVYTFPGHERIGTFALPHQRQGEGISVGPDDQLYLSTEGQFTDVLRMRLPRDLRAAVSMPHGSSAPSIRSTAPMPSATAEPAEPEEPADRDVWPWALGGAGLVFVAGAGWLLLRRGQAS